MDKSQVIISDGLYRINHKRTKDRFEFTAIINGKELKVGYMTASIGTDATTNTNILEVEDILIEDKYQNQGLGSILVKLVLNYYCIRKITGYVLNYQACRFWVKFTTIQTNIPYLLDNKQLDNWCFESGGYFEIT